jgi:hypothetical protein
VNADGSRRTLRNWLAALVLGVVVAGCFSGQTQTSAPSLEPTTSPSASTSPSEIPSESPSAVPSASSSPGATVGASPSATACLPTDQDADVYHPARLVVITACIRVTGTVYSMKTEADGDLHIRLTVDPPYANLVNTVNVSGQLGKLVIEPVCEKPVTQADAIATCKADKDPLVITGLKVGAHVWMEGRYVTDSQHGGWAELHPLYRWGAAP